MQEMILRLNPALDPQAHADAYARDGYVQIPDVFEPEVADALGRLLETGIDWDLVYLDAEQRGVTLTRANIAAMGREALRERLVDLNKRAGAGLGLLYSGYGMITSYKEGRDPGHPIHQVTEFINSPEFLDFGAAVTGQPQVRKADAQATFYRPGDYIGLHDDTGWESGHRLTAYTLGFTRRWRSDWGGQLIFHDDRGDIERGFTPRWNTLTFFKVPRLHSVAPVAAYAQAPRVSIVGWLRDDAPETLNR
jgi:SM-20-related protein